MTHYTPVVKDGAPSALMGILTRQLSRGKGVPSLAGSTIGIVGWYDDGRILVSLPGGGSGTLGRLDLDIRFMPDLFVPSWRTLPMRSFIGADHRLIPEDVAQGPVK